nr:Ig-like domain-containing protein [Brevibacillus fulvus]
MKLKRLPAVLVTAAFLCSLLIADQTVFAESTGNIGHYDLQTQNELSLDDPERGGQSEHLRWTSVDDQYFVEWTGREGQLLFSRMTPPFFQPVAGWTADLNGDARPELLLVFKEASSAGAASFWVVEGGEQPQLVYQSDEYPQGQVEVKADGVYVQYSVYRDGDATAFPSERVTEHWTGIPFTKLSESRSETSNRWQTTAAARTSKNPPLAEIEAELEEVAEEYGIPAVIFKAVAWQESSWRQFDSNGNPLISYDGGIGMMQLTNQTRFDQQRLKYDLRYNLEAGAQVLLEKRAYTESGLLPRIGKMDKDEMESWYFALWAYNGWSQYNNPHNIPNKFRTTLAYQDNIIKIAREQFGQPITPIPRELIPASGVPGGSKRYDTPLPIHEAGEDVERRHFAEGDTVEVAAAAGSLNVRQAPGMREKVVDTLQARERAEILSGPREKDDLFWYQIKSDRGKGWVAGYYLIAVRDETISLEQVWQKEIERLDPNALKRDGRNLYLQGEDLNIAWSDLDDGGLQDALLAYSWNQLWLEWTEQKRKQKLPEPSRDGLLQMLTPKWGEMLAADEPIELEFHDEIDPALAAAQFSVSTADGEQVDYRLSPGSHALSIKPQRQWPSGEALMLRYKGLPLVKFTVGGQQENRGWLDGYKLFAQVDLDRSVSKGISINFTLKLDKQSVTSRYIWLEDATGEKVAAELSLSKDGKSIYVLPKQRLQYDTFYCVKMTTGLRSVHGKALKQKTVYLFKTVQK